MVYINHLSKDLRKKDINTEEVICNENPSNTENKHDQHQASGKIKGINKKTYFPEAIRRVMGTSDCQMAISLFSKYCYLFFVL